jgi:hypothetical protein
VTRIILHSDCPSADLIVDAVYEGGQAKDAGSDAISKVMPGSATKVGSERLEPVTTKNSSCSTPAAKTETGRTVSI